MVKQRSIGSRSCLLLLHYAACCQLAKAREAFEQLFVETPREAGNVSSHDFAGPFNFQSVKICLVSLQRAAASAGKDLSPLIILLQSYGDGRTFEQHTIESGRLSLCSPFYHQPC